MFMSLNYVEMLTVCHAVMDREQFNSLPNSTNTVESHNRLTKGVTPNILHVAMISTYKIDMSNVLEHIAREKGLSTSYKNLQKRTVTRHPEPRRGLMKKRVTDLPINIEILIKVFQFALMTTSFYGKFVYCIAGNFGEH